MQQFACTGKPSDLKKVGEELYFIKVLILKFVPFQRCHFVMNDPATFQSDKYRKHGQPDEISGNIWKILLQIEVFNINAWLCVQTHCAMLDRKLVILTEDQHTMLNKGDELPELCRHQSKHFFCFTSYNKHPKQQLCTLIKGSVKFYPSKRLGFF